MVYYLKSVKIMNLL